MRLLIKRIYQMCLSRLGMTKADSAQAWGSTDFLCRIKTSNLLKTFCAVLGKWRVGYRFCLPDSTSLDWITYVRKPLPGLASQIPVRAQLPQSLQPQWSGALTPFLVSAPSLSKHRPCSFPGGFLVSGLIGCLSTSSQVEYFVLCNIFIHKHMPTIPLRQWKIYTSHPEHM